MRFTLAEIKLRLGHGGLTKIARKTNRALNIVHYVAKGTLRDATVERHLAKALGITVEELRSAPPAPIASSTAA